MKKLTELDAHLVEQHVESKMVFSGKLLHVLKDTVVLPNGVRATREYIVHPGASMVVPYLGNGNYLVERQYRYPNRQIFLEFPAGKRDVGESAAATAMRELEEETGYRAGRLAFLAPIHNAIGYSNERIDLFYADELTLTVQKLDENEFVELVEMPLDEMLSAVQAGQITDVKTIIGLMWAEKIAAGKWPLEWLDLSSLQKRGLTCSPSSVPM